MPQRLAQHLIARGLLPARVVDEALRRLGHDGGTLDTVLLEMGAVSEAGILQAISDVSGVRLVNLADFEPNTEAGPLMPYKMARQLNVVPLSVDGTALHLACTYPLQQSQLKDVGFLLGRKLELWVALEARVRDWQEALYKQKNEPRYQRLLAQLDPSRPRPRDAASETHAETESISNDVLERIARGIVEEPLLLDRPKPRPSTPRKSRPQIEIVEEAPALGDDVEEPRTSVLDPTAYSRFAEQTARPDAPPPVVTAPAQLTEAELHSTRVVDVSGYKNFAREVSSTPSGAFEPPRPSTPPPPPRISFPGGVLPPRKPGTAAPSKSAQPVSFVQPASAPRPGAERLRPAERKATARPPPVAEPPVAREEFDFSDVNEVLAATPGEPPQVPPEPPTPPELSRQPQGAPPLITRQPAAPIGVLDAPTNPGAPAPRASASRLVRAPEALAGKAPPQQRRDAAATTGEGTAPRGASAPATQGGAQAGAVQPSDAPRGGARAELASAPAAGSSELVSDASRVRGLGAPGHGEASRSERRVPGAEAPSQGARVGPLNDAAGSSERGQSLSARVEGSMPAAGADTPGAATSPAPGGATAGSTPAPAEAPPWSSSPTTPDLSRAEGLLPSPPGLAASTATEWSLAQARQALRESTNDRDRLITVALEYGRRTFEYVGAFAVMRGAAVGWDARGDNAAGIRQLAVPLDTSSVFRTVSLTRGSYVGPLPPDALSQHYLALLGRMPRTVFLWPVEVQSRLVAMIYGDCGGRPISQRRLADFILFCQDLPSAFHELILFRRQNPQVAQQLTSSSGLLPDPGRAQDGVQPASTPDGEWFNGLITLLTGPDASERSMAMMEFMKTPEASARALAGAFPGPTGWSRLPVVELPEPDELGPVPGALARLGQAGAAALAPLLDAEDSDARYLALLTAGSLRYPDVVDGVLRGLFDFEPDLSSAARSAAAALRLLPHFQSRLGSLRQELASPDMLRRSLAARALGVLHDRASIEGLINLTGSDDELCAQSASDALREITRAGFGSNTAGWTAWWAAAREQRRIEWIVEALDAEEFDLRLAAIEELSRTFGDNFGYFADGPEAERAGALARWRAVVASRTDLDL